METSHLVRAIQYVQLYTVPLARTEVCGKKNTVWSRRAAILDPKFNEEHDARISFGHRARVQQPARAGGRLPGRLLGRQPARKHASNEIPRAHPVMTAPEMATLFVNSICYKHGRGVPLSVLSDNDKLFTANFFRTLFERFGTKWNFSTARSQSTDGQAERYVAVVEEILDYIYICS